jgi:hypothetical protein
LHLLVVVRSRSTVFRVLRCSNTHRTPRKATVATLFAAPITRLVIVGHRVHGADIQRPATATNLFSTIAGYPATIARCLLVLLPTMLASNHSKTPIKWSAANCNQRFGKRMPFGFANGTTLPVVCMWHELP